MESVCLGIPLSWEILFYFSQAGENGFAVFLRSVNLIWSSFLGNITNTIIRFLGLLRTVAQYHQSNGGL